MILRITLRVGALPKLGTLGCLPCLNDIRGRVKGVRAAPHLK
jgi:hypothetical protein